jgi:leucyl/phenylalanyl-tRNA--protein transferase
MRRLLNQGRFRFTWNRAFRAVMEACGDREEGTWILPEMIDAYCELHRLGHAHSIEVWENSELVGGLYGVQRGALFAAESMFHRSTNASKAALIECVENVFSRGIELFDVQFVTSHLSSLGAREIPRKQYIEQVTRARHRQVDLASLGHM